MVKVQASMDIARPVHEVFSFVRDETNMPAWDSDLIKATKTSPGPTGEGTTLHLDIKPFMGAVEGSGEIVGYAVDEKIELQFQMGSLRPHVWNLFESVGDGTRFTRRVELPPPGVMKLMSPLMRIMLSRRNRQHVSDLKRLLEAGI